MTVSGQVRTTAFETALAEILERRVGARGVAGLALIGAGSEGPAAVWVPRALHEEPAFLAYSITKTFTAALLLRLQEEGRLGLDAPLSRWFPCIAASDRISLRQLLNHSAGIPDYGGLRAYHEAVRASPGSPWSFERFAAETLERGLLFEPGTSWAYSNPGYMLLKRIAEELTGESYASLVSGRIARPLGLHRTRVVESVRDLAPLAAAPSRALSPDGRTRDTREVYHPGWVSHGVVASTPSEIARFLDALLGGSLLSLRSLREMTTLLPVPQAPPRWRRPGYGLGLMGDPGSPWGAILGHGGGGPGYGACALRARGLDGRARTACAMCALEEAPLAEQLVLAVLELDREAPAQ